MNNSPKRRRLPKFQNSCLLLLTLPQLTLLIFVAGLLVMMVSACIKFTKGPVNTSALAQQLQRLQAKFTGGLSINPQKEREEMEKLQNKLKTTSTAALISGNANLKQLFYSNCKAIQAVLRRSDLQNRTAWIKLNALLVDFDALYFGK